MHTLCLSCAAFVFLRFRFLVGRGTVCGDTAKAQFCDVRARFGLICSRSRSPQGGHPGEVREIVEGLRFGS